VDLAPDGVCTLAKLTGARAQCRGRSVERLGIRNGDTGAKNLAKLGGGRRVEEQSLFQLSVGGYSWRKRR
jgi:hypothetical protein